jgi:hypothetical protein
MPAAAGRAQVPAVASPHRPRDTHAPQPGRGAPPRSHRPRAAPCSATCSGTTTCQGSCREHRAKGGEHPSAQHHTRIHRCVVNSRGEDDEHTARAVRTAASKATQVHRRTRAGGIRRADDIDTSKPRTLAPARARSPTQHPTHRNQGVGRCASAARSPDAVRASMENASGALPRGAVVHVADAPPGAATRPTHGTPLTSRVATASRPDPVTVSRVPPNAVPWCGSGGGGRQW